MRNVILHVLLFGAVAVVFGYIVAVAVSRGVWEIPLLAGFCVAVILWLLAESFLQSVRQFVWVIGFIARAKQ